MFLAAGGSRALTEEGRLILPAGSSEMARGKAS